MGAWGGRLPADGNGDGMITQLDYDEWKANFGAVSPGIGSGSIFSQSANVPEPTSTALGLLALASFAWRVRSVRFARDHVCAGGLPPYNDASIDWEPTRSRPR